MAMKGYSSFPKAPALLKPHDQIILCHIQDTRREGLSPLQKSSRCILQPQPTRQKLFLLKIILKLVELSIVWELIFIYCGLFVLILVVFVLFLLSQRFDQISPLAFFRWFTVTSDRNAESCNRIPSNYCLPWLLSIAPRFWPSKRLAGLGSGFKSYPSRPEVTI